MKVFKECRCERCGEYYTSERVNVYKFDYSSCEIKESLNSGICDECLRDLEISIAMRKIIEHRIKM
jgi:hypothetical protein